MHNCFRPVLSERSIYSNPVCQVPLHEDRVRVNGSPMTLEEIIEDDNRLAGVDELLNDDTADVASATSY
jgi:hypothetical protein